MGRSLTAIVGGSHDFGHEDGAADSRVDDDDGIIGTRTTKGDWERAIMWPATTAAAPVVINQANANPNTSPARDSWRGMVRAIATGALFWLACQGATRTAPAPGPDKS
jgi:hypothetical protein